MEGMFYWEESNRFLEFLMGAWGGGSIEFQKLLFTLKLLFSEKLLYYNNWDKTKEK